MNYEEIISNLEIESVISMMEKLGADRYVDRGEYVLFPTICHNIDSSEASMKLYFYKDTKYLSVIPSAAICLFSNSFDIIMKQDRLSMIGTKTSTK